MKPIRQFRIDLKAHFQVLNEAFDDTKPESTDNSMFRRGDRTLGRVMASVLYADTSHDALKFTTWAIQLHGGGVLSVDEADFEMLRGFVKRHGQIVAAAKVQIEDAFKAAEKEDPMAKVPTEE